MIKTITLFLSLLLASYCEAPAATYYASPAGTGNGLNPSTPASVTAAKGIAIAGDTIYLRGGEYRLSAPLSLGSANSGVTWAAYPGETPIISGGIVVTGWTHAPEYATNGAWQASIPPGTVSRQLYVNGVRAQRARRSTGMNYFSTPSAGAAYISTDASMPALARPQDVEFVFNSPGNFKWTQIRLGVSSASRSGSNTTFTMDSAYSYWNANTGTGGWPSAPNWVENAYEFLTTATQGSWYLNASTNTLYYVPRAGEDMATVDVRLPVLEQLITTSQSDPASNVTFSGVAFEYATWLKPSAQRSFLQVQSNQYLDSSNGYYWGATGGIAPPAAVSLLGTSSVKFQNCTFSHLGATALAIGQGSKNCEVRSSSFTDISGLGVRVGEVTNATPASGDQVSGTVIRDNTITNVGNEYYGANGVVMGYVDTATVLHNEIANIPYTGIGFGWGWANIGYSNGNEIAYNKIHDVLTVLHDGAGIYSLGSQGSPGNTAKVHDNYIYNVGNGVNHTPDSCIYADEGSHYINYYNNVVVRSIAGTPNNWWFTNGAASGSNTATANYATSGMVIGSTNGASTSGISAATIITGTDPAGWPAGAQAIVAASGPTAVVTPAAASTATMRASFR